MRRNDFTQEWAEAHLIKMDRLRGCEDLEDVPDDGLESKLQRKVLDYCKEKGWPCFHDRSQKVNDPGWIDNFIFLPRSKVVLIELKSRTGVFSEEQKHLRVMLFRLEHIVHTARSFRKVVEILENELLG